jgi:single-stranded-DNA-specific exonuclease
MQPGLRALLRVAGRRADTASTFDLGFAVAPRLNAAGRMADMALGIECLVSDDEARTLNIAQELDSINRERREIEAGMQEGAAAILEGIAPSERASLTLYNPEWHQGIIGIVAGRVKERLHRPTFVFARGLDRELKGSGRSIPGLHLRDALDLVAKHHPDLLLRFGGHAAAAGVSIIEQDIDRFKAAFEETCQQLLAPADRTRTLETDGALETGYLSLESAHLLRREIWGQGFPPPVFSDVFEVAGQRVLKDKHLKLALCKGKSRFDAIQFNFAGGAPPRIRAAFRLDANQFNGVENLQLLLEHFEPE